MRSHMGLWSFLDRFAVRANRHFEHQDKINKLAIKEGYSLFIGKQVNNDLPEDHVVQDESEENPDDQDIEAR
jgi:hypothetical protein